MLFYNLQTNQDTNALVGRPPVIHNTQTYAEIINPARLRAVNHFERLAVQSTLRLCPHCWNSKRLGAVLSIINHSRNIAVTIDGRTVGHKYTTYACMRCLRTLHKVTTDRGDMWMEPVMPPDPARLPGRVYWNAWTADALAVDYRSEVMALRNPAVNTVVDMHLPFTHVYSINNRPNALLVGVRAVDVPWLFEYLPWLKKVVDTAFDNRGIMYRHWLFAGIEAALAQAVVGGRRWATVMKTPVVLASRVKSQTEHDMVWLSFPWNRVGIGFETADGMPVNAYPSQQIGNELVNLRQQLSTPPHQRLETAAKCLIYGIVCATINRHNWRSTVVDGLIDSGVFTPEFLHVTAMANDAQIDTDVNDDTHRDATAPTIVSGNCASIVAALEVFGNRGKGLYGK